MSAAPASPKLRVDGRLIVGGMAHDFDYARLELLTALAAHEHVRVSVSDSFEDVDALSRGRFLITYTCNLQPSTAAERALADFVEGGGRWFALHATNSLLAWTEQGVAARAEAPLFMEVLGSQFAAHPPIGSFRVENVAPHHPLTAGVDAFDTVDELYLSRLSGNLELLLATRFSGEAPGFIDSDWTDDALRPVLYCARAGPAPCFIVPSAIAAAITTRRIGRLISLMWSAALGRRLRSERSCAVGSPGQPKRRLLAPRPQACH